MNAFGNSIAGLMFDNNFVIYYVFEREIGKTRWLIIIIIIYEAIVLMRYTLRKLVYANNDNNTLKTLLLLYEIVRVVYRVFANLYI